jgi:glycosyltransferase involved in cell wall biosynthesis
MLASVIICTRNRAASLARALSSIVTAAEQVGADWEILVVDNGSTDDTAATIASFADALPIRRIDQPVPGLSNARNAGVAAAQGDYIVWTDDDVMVDRRWLAAWFKAFRDHPGDAVFGGRTEPVFEAPETAWFTANQQHLQWLLAVRDAAWTTVGPHQMPWGLNFAVRTTEQRAQTFDPRLGVAPGRRTGGEEVDVILRILHAGGSGRWVWDATVFHLIPPERQTAAYIDYFYRASGFEYPVAGPRYGVRGRLGGLKVAAGQLVKSTALVQWGRLRGQRNVAHMVRRAAAIGSVLRYLKHH